MARVLYARDFEDRFVSALGAGRGLRTGDGSELPETERLEFIRQSLETGRCQPGVTWLLHSGLPVSQDGTRTMRLVSDALFRELAETELHAAGRLTELLGAPAVLKTTGGVPDACSPEALDMAFSALHEHLRLAELPASEDPALETVRLQAAARVAKLVALAVRRQPGDGVRVVLGHARVQRLARDIRQTVPDDAQSRREFLASATGDGTWVKLLSHYRRHELALRSLTARQAQQTLRDELLTLSYRAVNIAPSPAKPSR